MEWQRFPAGRLPPCCAAMAPEYTVQRDQSPLADTTRPSHPCRPDQGAGVFWLEPGQHHQSVAFLLLLRGIAADLLLTLGAIFSSFASSATSTTNSFAFNSAKRCRETGNGAL